MEIGIRAKIKNNIEVDHIIKYAIAQVQTVNVDPAPIISSISVSELPKSKTGKTFVITGGNFLQTSSVTSTAGTISSYTIDSATQISVVINTNSSSNYQSVTVTTNTGTTTLSNAIRMYTEVIPGTDIAWNNVTGGSNISTGSGYIRKLSAENYTDGANFLVTSGTSDFEVEYYYDNTNFAINLSWYSLNGLSLNATASSNRYANNIYYWEKGYLGSFYNFFVKITPSSGTFANNNYTYTTSTRFWHKRESGILINGIDNTRVITYPGNSTAAMYMNFNPAKQCGFKNIKAKIYD